VASNTADHDAEGTGDGGGVAQREMSTLTSTASIIAENADPSSFPDCSGTLTSGGYNVLGVPVGCTIGNQPTDRVGNPAGIGPLADNGGPTMTHGLLRDSLARDLVPKGGPGCTDPDQRGVPRSQGRGCDSGAYELTFCGKAVVNRVGASGGDVLTGTGKGDGLLGLDGNDRLNGKGGKDGLCGGPGKDKLRGGGGKDLLRGEGGKDTCVGQGGRDKARGCEKTRRVP
jgi:hypothetical protein